jgi:hypothetical protein
MISGKNITNPSLTTNTNYQNTGVGQNLSKNQTSGGVKSRNVLMLGRSVTNGWMNHLKGEWLCLDEKCDYYVYKANYSGYMFIYYELSSPPDIVATAIDGLNTYGNNADTVFFKLCFVDFEADSSGENFKRNTGYVESIYNEVVVKRNKKLIVGNALPMVSQYTDNELVSAHKKYNQWLNSFESSHAGVKVLNLYGILADANGNLKKNYALDQYDSHLKDVAYTEITSEFMKVIEK